LLSEFAKGRRRLTRHCPEVVSAATVQYKQPVFSRLAFDVSDKELVFPLAVFAIQFCATNFRRGATGRLRVLTTMLQEHDANFLCQVDEALLWRV
jgi:hypothetical protein